MTRSSIETAKVTPAALTACRSIGASSQGLVRRRACRRRVGEDRRPASRSRSPSAARSARAGSALLAEIAHGRRTSRETSKTPLSRIATTDGPPCVRSPDPAGESAAGPVVREGSLGRDSVDHGGFLFFGRRTLARHGELGKGGQRPQRSASGSSSRASSRRPSRVAGCSGCEGVAHRVAADDAARRHHGFGGPQAALPVLVVDERQDVRVAARRPRCGGRRSDASERA